MSGKGIVTQNMILKQWRNVFARIYVMSPICRQDRSSWGPVENYIQNDFPHNVIRSKGLFWLDSRPNQAMTWGQAGGSLKADSAGVWWSSIPMKERSNYADFMSNQEVIEKDWNKQFGDRKNELVFIGQDLNKEKIVMELNNCLSSDNEIVNVNWESGIEDSWPVQRAIPPHKQDY